MGTNCAPLVADLILFCYESNIMMSLSDDKQADIIDAFNTSSKYLDDISNINYVYFDMCTALACGAPCSMPVKLGHLPRRTCSACNAMIGP